jgi:alpha-ribazole phosphatase
MQDIYLIRHTTPAVARGICYGQTDLDTTESFLEEAEVIRACLPVTIGAVYSSPLRRCARLASHLFPNHPLVLRQGLMEVHCGEWEMQSWDALPKEEIDPWMSDFVNVRIPGGESYLDLHERVTRCWEEIVAVAAAPAAGHLQDTGSSSSGPIAVVAHGGVIRSILSGISGTPLIDSFKVFALYYGCVVRISAENEELRYNLLSNPAPSEKEQHKPSSFYKK